MFKTTLLTTLLAALLSISINANSAIILQNGETYSSSFALNSAPEAIMFTDNFWEVIVAIYDRENDPFRLPIINPSSVTLTLFENTNYTNQVYSQTLDTRDWIADYGVLFSGTGGFFGDLNGSFSVSYSGGNQATLMDIAIRNYAGQAAPSYIAQTVITPTVSPVPVPAALWLFASGLIGLSGFSRFRKNS